MNVTKKIKIKREDGVIAYCNLRRLYHMIDNNINFDFIDDRPRVIAEFEKELGIIILNPNDIVAPIKEKVVKPKKKRGRPSKKNK